MPMIQAKVTVPMTAEESAVFHTELTQAVVDILHKPVEYVMVHVEDDADLWMGGKKLKRGAFLSFLFMGEQPDEACAALTERVCQVLARHFSIPGANVYTTFQTVRQWGSDGVLF